MIRKICQGFSTMPRSHVKNCTTEYVSQGGVSLCRGGQKKVKGSRRLRYHSNVPPRFYNEWEH